MGSGRSGGRVRRKAPKRSPQRKTNRRKGRPSHSEALISRRWFDRLLGAGAALGAVGAARAVTRRWAWREGLATVTPLGIAWLPEEIERHRGQILQAAVTHGVDPKLIAIIILVESRGNPAAQSPVGARGLMQVMPRTARYIAKKRDLDFDSANLLYDPAINIDYGTWFLGELLDQFAQRDHDRTVELAAGAYNGGPGRMRKHLDKGRTLPRETRRYMETVAGLWQDRHHADSPTLARLWPGKGGRGRA